jgi:hypothetical protein
MGATDQLRLPLPTVAAELVATRYLIHLLSTQKCGVQLIKATAAQASASCT